MTAKKESFQYRFSDIVLIGHRCTRSVRTTWYIECPECQGQHMFKRAGAKIWHTSCWLSGVEWTITPAEYYICRPMDFSKILGDI